MKTKPHYTCAHCSRTGEETRFIVKVLSIMFRPKYDNIQAFKQVKCPRCTNLVTILFETLKHVDKPKNEFHEIMEREVQDED